jgi:hypothetical protein
MGLITTRRSVLAGMVGLLAAPAIVRAASLMPVRALAQGIDGIGHLEGMVVPYVDPPLMLYRDEFIKAFEQNCSWLRARSVYEEAVPFEAIRFRVVSGDLTQVEIS